MKSTLAKMFVLIAGLIACFQWGQIAYRFGLFYYQCNGERGFNHIGGGFEFAYFIDGALFVIGISVLCLWRNTPGFWRACALAFVLANLAGGITLFNLHRTGVLVEYGEFICNWQHSGQIAPHDNSDSTGISCNQAEVVASNYLSTRGYTNLRWRGGSVSLAERFSRLDFSTNSSVSMIKVVVDRVNGKVGYDYSHW